MLNILPPLITASEGNLTYFWLKSFHSFAFNYFPSKRILPTNLVVRLGEQRVGANDETMPHYEIPVTAVVGHPEFAEGSLFNDMAVLMLAMAAPSGLAHISPICLPSPSEQVGPQCVASGWGHDTISGNLNSFF